MGKVTKAVGWMKRRMKGECTSGYLPPEQHVSSSSSGMPEETPDTAQESSADPSESEVLSTSDSSINNLEDFLKMKRRHKELIYGRYGVVTSPEYDPVRRTYVLLARDCRSESRELVRMTLFEDETHFNGEMALYEDNEVNNTWLMPALRALHTAPYTVQRGSRTSANVPLPIMLPPAIVTVCGFTLDAWVPLSIAPAEQPKFYEIMDAITQVTTHLRAMHMKGLVHGDIRPGTLLCCTPPKALPHMFALIGFGCTSDRGIMAPIRRGFTLEYAAPEVLEAIADGEDVVRGEAERDIWSLGVAAFELLTGDRAYPTTTLSNAPEAAQVAAGHPVTRRSSGDTSPCIGRGPFPWEKEAAGAAAKLRKLGVLKKAVLWCLEVHSYLRPSAHELLGELQSISRVTARQ